MSRRNWRTRRKCTGNSGQDYAHLGEVVDLQGYTENCLGLTGWTTGFEVARVIGQWIQPDLWGIYQQLTSGTPEPPRMVAAEPALAWAQSAR